MSHQQPSGAADPLAAHGQGAHGGSSSVTASGLDLLRRVDLPLWILRGQNFELIPAQAGGSLGAAPADAVGLVPARRPQDLGDPAFRTAHGLRYAYVCGAMANGIASSSLVRAIAKAGGLGFFGAAGLGHDKIARAIDEIQSDCAHLPYGVNLIHTPNENSWESKAVDLLLAKKVHLIEASAYLDLTPQVVRFRLHGLQEVQGKIIAPNRVVAKISRVEVAAKFLSPAPEKILQKLLAEGSITEQQAQLARQIPVAEDLSAEADSGGHTDNRPAIAMLPTMLALRDRIQAQYNYKQAPRVGLGGGISTPASAAAAFAMGAAYLLTGSINQACIESGASDLVREMLAAAQQADTAMAPAADMFEMGVTLQVLKRGTMFPMRAHRLYDFYRQYSSLESLSPADRDWLEKQLLRAPIAEIWERTKAFFAERDPEQIRRAEAEPKHKMALVFRWYLGLSSHWANRGQADRKLDFQIWSGPAMGAFNEWSKGSFLEQVSQRRVAVLAQNLLYGAALMDRLNSLRAQGFPVPSNWFQIIPQEPKYLEEFFR